VIGWGTVIAQMHGMWYEPAEWDGPIGARAFSIAAGECVPLSAEERSLSARVQGEFHEMPGLMLTIPQAARLFNLDRVQCLRILQSLVDSGHLITDGSRFRCASPHAA
jgi:hypothetical protein